MRYVMRQKWFSLGYNFAIRNEAGEKVYLVVGKLISVGDKLSFQDAKGNELAFIHQTPFQREKTYLIDYRGGSITMKRQVSTPPRFVIDTPGGDALEAQGDLSDHEYQIARGGRAIASVSKQWFTMDETYGVEIAANEDPVLILAASVAIDMCSHVRAVTTR